MVLVLELEVLEQFTAHTAKVDRFLVENLYKIHAGLSMHSVTSFVRINHPS
jgi:hypothetical protein